MEDEEDLAGEEDTDWSCEQSTSADIQVQPQFSHQGLKEVSPNRTVQKRTIVHIDIDCFYAQVEMIRNPELRDKPLGVQQKYLLVTCNYRARELGVSKMMGVREAKKKCPQLVLVSGEDLTHYRNMSYKISEQLLQFSPLVERLGFDENFVDITDLVEQRLASGNYSGDITGHIFQSHQPASTQGAFHLVIGSQIASEIRAALHSHLQITCCAGVAHNKLLSKLVAGANKPNQQTTLFPEQTDSLLNSLSGISKIPGIGWTTSKRLNSLGVHTIQDLRDIPMVELAAKLGESVTATIKKLSHGIDESLVSPYGRPQTLSDEDSFRKCCTLADAQLKMEDLLQNLLTRLLDDGRVPRTLRLTVRRFTVENKWTNRESRQCPIASNIFNNFDSGVMEKVCSQLLNVLVSLFKRLVDVSKSFHLTLINVAFCKLETKPKVSINKFFSKMSAFQNMDVLEIDHERNNNESKLVHVPINTSSLSCIKMTASRKNSTIDIISGNKNSRMVDISLNQTSCNDAPVLDLIPECKHNEHLESEQKLNSGRSVIGMKRKWECKIGSSSSGFFAKKQRSASGEQMDAKSNTSHKLDCTVKGSCIPLGIDMEVFCELPSCIQEEIREKYSHHRQPDTLTMSTSCTSATGEKSSSFGRTEKDLILGSEHGDIDDTQPQISCSEMSSDSCQLSKTRILPSDVDSGVFAALPPEIKAELVQQWKHVDKVMPKSKALKSPSKLKTKVKSANISSFFKKS